MSLGQQVRNLTKTLVLAGSIGLASCMSCPKAEELPRITIPNLPIEEKDYTHMTWQEAIKEIKTPTQATHYIKHHLHYDNTIERKVISPFFFQGDKARSFKYIHQRKTGNCFDYTVAIAALLSDDGYLPYCMEVKYKTTEGKIEKHAVFLFKNQAGISWAGYTTGFTFQDEQSLAKDVTESLSSKYQLIAYTIRDLRENNTSYINGEGNQETTKFQRWKTITTNKK